MVFHVSRGLAAAHGGFLTYFRRFHEKLFRKSQNRHRYIALVRILLPQGKKTPDRSESRASLSTETLIFWWTKLSFAKKTEGRSSATFNVPDSSFLSFCWRFLLPAEVFFPLSVSHLTTHAML